MAGISLNGDWLLYHFPEGKYAISHPSELQKVGLEAVPAQVPGDVQLDLQKAGLLPDPFVAANIHRLRPLETHEWWYSRNFSLSKSASHQRWELVFAGLDTLATVWVNGVEVGHSADMLIEQRFEVTQALKPGEVNTITVRLASPVNAARNFSYDAVAMSWEHRFEGLFIRKAPHQYGWDILPRAVTVGIWRPVWLEPVAENSFEQIYYWTADAGPQGAVLGVRFQFRTSSPEVDGFSVHFRGQCGEHVFEKEWPVEFTADGCLIEIPGAKLWWPKGYGEPNLYTITAQLCREGKVLAERVDRIGLRKIVVDRTDLAGLPWMPESAHNLPARIDTPPDPEYHFVIYVNGEPVQVKGTNWVPLDAFHSRDAERVEPAIGLVEELGCNMIRCWGGNVYESDRFFDLCDEKGFMVWQDFAYACCIYPQTEDFLAQVQKEAEAIARRLRNHACLAVWCGDNEIDAAYWSERLSPEQNRLTRQVIPLVLHRLDPHRTYIPSSPHTPPKAYPTGATTEQHLWGPRGYYKSPFYTLHSAHFIGEIGYHGCPNRSSMERFLSPESLWPWQDNAEWQVHAVYHWQHQAIDRDRIKLMANQVQELFGHVPEDLDDFILASQMTQAEAKKFFIESTRLRKWRTTGLLWWNVLDGWPQFSDAVVDYYFGKKLAYHYIRRSQVPVCVMIGEPGSGKYLPVVVANDSREEATLHYRIWDAETGETLLDDSFTSPPNQNWQVGRIRTFASQQRLYLIEWKIDQRTFGNHYLSGTPPFNLDQCKRWLKMIAGLEPVFDFNEVGI